MEAPWAAGKKPSRAGKCFAGTAFVLQDRREFATKMNAFDKFFATATGHGTPFDYQARLAGGNDGTACESKLINPERIRGGKTAAAVNACLEAIVCAVAGRASQPPARQ